MKNSKNAAAENARENASRQKKSGHSMHFYPASLWNQEKAGGILALLSQPAVEKNGEQLLPFGIRMPYNRRGAAGDEQKREEE